MFEPISARLASSFSRNGISAAATDTSCFGDTSIRSMFSRGVIITSPEWRQTTNSSTSGRLRKFGVGLGNKVLGLFHRREIDHFLGDLAVGDLAVGAFDEAVLVDPGEGRQRVDQTDVRAFRRLDRADTAIVGGVHVADFEARAFTRQTARSKRRQTALVGDFRERVGLVHELRQLRGAEEFTHRGGSRLGVDQVLRHDRVDLDRGHALLDRALHTQQAKTVLVFHQLADRTHAAVAEVVDVVDLALAVTQRYQRA
jgi:hypothetical protein